MASPTRHKACRTTVERHGVVKYGSYQWPVTNTSTGEAGNRAVGKQAGEGMNERLETLPPSRPQRSLIRNNIGRTLFQKANYMIVSMEFGPVRLQHSKVPTS